MTESIKRRLVCPKCGDVRMSSAPLNCAGPHPTEATHPWTLMREEAAPTSPRAYVKQTRPAGPLTPAERMFR